jgi:hypothetical protein
MCSFNLGDYVDAVLNLENALVDTRKPLTEEQQRHVADLITRANRRIGRFRMRLVPSETTLTADGQPAVVLAQSELLLEAGHHELEARAAGYQSAHSRVHVEGGDRSTLVFNLGRDSGAVADAASGANVSGVVGATPSVSGATLRLDSQSPPPTRSDSGSIVRTLGILSLSVGAAGLVAFGVTGALALGERGKLDDHCDDSRCPQEYSSDIDRYNTLRTTATITLISGGVLAALGVTLLLAGPSEHAESRQQAKLQPWIGLGSIGVRGQL